MKKILLINRGFSDNLGEQAIRCCMEGLLTSLKCKVDFRDLTDRKKKEINYNKEAAKKLSVKSLYNRVKNNTLLRLYWFITNVRMFKIVFQKKYDVVLIGGGQLINSNISFPLAVFLWVNLFRKFSNSKIVFFGVGSITKLKRIDKLLFKNALRKVDSIYLRDAVSIDFISKEFGVESIYTPDVAFCINFFYPINNRKKEKKVLIGLTEYSRYAKYNDDKDEIQYLTYWENLILDYHNKGFNVSLFYTTVNDLVEAIKMRKHIKEKYNIIIHITVINNLDDLINEISKAAIVISQRMHALIIARVYGCEVIPIIISDKIKAFKEQYLDKDVPLDYLQGEIIRLLQKAID